MATSPATACATVRGGGPACIPCPPAHPPGLTSTPLLGRPQPRGATPDHHAAPGAARHQRRRDAAGPGGRAGGRRLCGPGLLGRHAGQARVGWLRWGSVVASVWQQHTAEHRLCRLGGCPPSLSDALLDTWSAPATTRTRAQPGGRCRRRRRPGGGGGAVAPGGGGAGGGPGGVADRLAAGCHDPVHRIQPGHRWGCGWTGGRLQLSVPAAHARQSAGMGEAQLRVWALPPSLALPSSGSRSRAAAPPAQARSRGGRAQTCPPSAASPCWTTTRSTWSVPRSRRRWRARRRRRSADRSACRVSGSGGDGACCPAHRPLQAARM